MIEFSTVPQPRTINPYANLMKAVVIQSMKDFARGYRRKEIKVWVNNLSGSFPICAEAMGLSQYILQEMMIKKIKDIESGKPLLSKNGIIKP